MNKKTILLLSAVSLMLLTACSGKLGALSADNFKVTPNPLETNAGHVQATIDGAFPEKYLKKNAVVTVIPELRFQTTNGLQTVKGQPATFQGEKVLGNDQTISYLLGGHYTMKTDFPYQPEMLRSDMYLSFDARVGKKAVEVPAVKVATGVIATSELYHQTLVGASPVLAADAFQRITQVKQEANIKFLVAQTQLRKSELQNNSVKEFINLLQRINNERETLSLTNVEVSAYASPEGSLSLNERLASGRQEVSADYVEQQLKRTRLNAPVDTRYTAEDWEGFQQLVRASDIQDKDVILRVLSMYEDPEEREQQIRNMSEAFRELADGILPELRRARLIANYEVIGRDNQQIMQQFRDDASQLSIEELLYAAALANNADEKMAIYQRTTQLFPNDARAYNNIGRLYYQQRSYDLAKQYFERTLSVDHNSTEAYANLGLLELLNGNIDEAQNLISRASGSDNIAEVLGNLHLAQGNYALAEQDFSGVSSNSAALVQILNKNYAKAEQTLGKITNKDAMTDYLRAVLYARKGNNGVAGAFLRSAIEKDPSLQAYAARDLELKNIDK